MRVRTKLIRAAISVSPSAVSISFIFCSRSSVRRCCFGVMPAGGFRLQNRTSGRSKQSALVDRRQKSRSPAWRAAFRRAFRLRHHDICGQVFRLRAQSVCDPRADGRITHQDPPALHLVHCGRMDDALRVKAPHEADVVHTLRHVRKQPRDTQLRYARAVLNLPRDDRSACCRLVNWLEILPKLSGSFCPSYFFNRRLGVEGVDLARRTHHEQEDDRLRFRGKVRRLRRQRIDTRRRRSRRGPAGC